MSPKKNYTKPEIRVLMIPDAWGQEISGACVNGYDVGDGAAVCVAGFEPQNPGSCAAGTQDVAGGCKTGHTAGL